MFKISVTIPAASVTANLSNFPVYINLADMPAGFWDYVAKNDGGDIRVLNSSETIIPFDLSGFNRQTKRGTIFAKTSLSTSSSTVLYIGFGDSSLSLLPATDANGRNAVWADYHRVILLGEDCIDRCGSGSSLSFWNGNKTMYSHIEGTLSAAVCTSEAQGLAFDGTYYYVGQNNNLRKYDINLNLVLEKTNPCGNISTIAGYTIDKIEDFEYYDGKLYIVAKYNTNPQQNHTIAIVNCSDLLCSATVNVAAAIETNDSITSITRGSDYWYVSGYGTKTFLYKFGLSDWSNQGHFALNSSVNNVQSVVWFNNCFYITGMAAVTGNDNLILKFDSSGNIKLPAIFYKSGGYLQGLHYRDGNLIQLYDNDAKIRTLVPADVGAGSGLVCLKATSQMGRMAGLSVFSNWTMGISFDSSGFTTGATEIFCGLDDPADGTGCERIGYQGAGAKVGTWNDTDLWNFGTAPAADTKYRLVATHNGTTDQKIYQNGVAYTNTGCAQRPDSSANNVYIGGSAPNGQPNDGRLGFWYIRSGILSAAWIAAESNNLLNRTGFYIVGAFDANSFLFFFLQHMNS